MVPDAGGLRMIRFVAAAGAAAICLLLATSAQPVAAPDARSLPMQFELWTEGPAQACGADCRTWVSASGAITSDTPRDFDTFAKKNKLDGTTIALDSDGGSVLGALGLGRAIRRLGMTTTVGKTIDLGATDGGRKRAQAPGAGLLRIDVRLRAARRRRAPRSGGGAGHGSSNLARRPPR